MKPKERLRLIKWTATFTILGALVYFWDFISNYAKYLLIGGVILLIIFAIAFPKEFSFKKLILGAKNRI